MRLPQPQPLALKTKLGGWPPGGRRALEPPRTEQRYEFSLDRPRPPLLRSSLGLRRATRPTIVSMNCYSLAHTGAVPQTISSQPRTCRAGVCLNNEDRMLDHLRSNLAARGSRKPDAPHSIIGEPDGGRALLWKVLGGTFLLAGVMWAAAALVQHST